MVAIIPYLLFSLSLAWYGVGAKSVVTDTVTAVYPPTPFHAGSAPTHQLSYHFDHSAALTQADAAVPFHITHGLAYSTAQDISREIRLIFTNDLHAHEVPFNHVYTDCTPEDVNQGLCVAGAARRATTFRALERGVKNVLRLDGGDVFEGHPLFNYYWGNDTALLMNYMRYNAMTIGNHEFDKGVAHLVRFYALLDFPVVCTNVDLTEEPSLAQYVKPSIKFPEYGIALVAFTTITTPFISTGTGQVKFLDPVKPVQDEIHRLRKEGYQTIVGLSHSGIKTDKQVGRETEGLDLIFGGHSHTYLSDDPDHPETKGPYPVTVYNRVGRPVYIVQAKKFGEYVGYLDVSLNAEGRITWLSGRPVHMGPDVPEDPEVRDLVEAMYRPVQKLSDQIMGHSAVDMPHPPCKVGECLLANLVTDALGDYDPTAPSLLSTEVSAKILEFTGTARPTSLGDDNALSVAATDTTAWPKADIVLINSDGMRSGLPAGPIRLDHIVGLFSFRDEIVMAKMTGRHIRNSIIGSVQEVSPVDQVRVTCFVQFSGVKMLYNPVAKTVHELYVPKKKVPGDPRQQRHGREGGHDTDEEEEDEDVDGGDNAPFPGWEAMDDNAVYNVLTLKYLADGNDHIIRPPIKDYTRVNDIVTILAHYLRVHGQVHPVIDGRMTPVEV
ncbi:hypothetical protein IWQ60_008360 [Tieghemiomyces parasiticus]|uniref:5'-nucleotidase n=1 Tax=Tieghemiomyces parasiticus TaxID=78921 RepID=A0A9W8A0K6_9FUNG|nr:hypothetical protein IWQ60_008360 [Tieghemiomyces parasiticus]